MKDSTHADSWYAASANRSLAFPRLQGEIEADVCIVGGGYTGLSSAIHLREKGYSVALLEAHRVGWGASGRNGGHCSVGQRADQEFLEKKVGREHARRLWDLGLEAVDTVCEMVDRFAIDCELKTGDLHVAAKRSHVDDLASYADKLQREYDYERAPPAPAQLRPGAGGGSRRTGRVPLRGESRHRLQRGPTGHGQDRRRHGQGPLPDPGL